MPVDLLMYILVVILAGTLSLFLCLYAHVELKDTPGAKPYMLVTLLSAIFTFSYAFELASPSLEQIKFWLNVEYLALPFIPVFILLMCFEYIGRSLNHGCIIFCLLYQLSPSLCTKQTTFIIYITDPSS